MGIEPTRPAWKAGILPLNYTRIVFSGMLSQNCLNIIPHFFILVNTFLKFFLAYFFSFLNPSRKFYFLTAIIEKYYCNKRKNVVSYIVYEKITKEWFIR